MKHETSIVTAQQRFPRYFQISSWAIPVMVVGQFSMIALLPVLVLVIASLADSRTRALRPWTLGLAVAYFIPLAIMKLRADPAQSLSKDMHPILLALIVAAAAVLLARMYRIYPRRPRQLHGRQRG
ncbi:hypothetical protein QMK17_03720 [Rhodococcus sp. G-MC3]|uniref:hypothetical protein n=1 Tax=Rhodococcus sp. G-MC3 TaxID=3046209 RepID=UPI0024BB068C|nr:hypothetical protein [Rhodococcus sp. G-MC3]MDJ0392441.1 hypothetical protein [Rhodococcus sp. G-MC3]